ncbi:MAG: anti-anti-sigma factor [Acidobacteria bacterium]|nr:MAG: anti-anti-sigma factor [Acidobacteriota bacterium]
MSEERLSIIKVRDILMVTMPADPDDATVSALQERVLLAMERSTARGVVLDVSAVDSLDSFFARMIAETTRMVGLMGGRTVLTGIRPSVAITLTQLGLTLGKTRTALSVDRAFEILRDGSQQVQKP